MRLTSVGPLGFERYICFLILHKLRLLSRRRQLQAMRLVEAAATSAQADRLVIDKKKHSERQKRGKSGKKSTHRIRNQLGEWTRGIP